MFFMKRCLALLAVLSLFASAAMADELFSLKGGYLKLHPDGKFAVSGGGVPGTSIDMDELGLDDSENYLVEAAMKFGSFRLYAAYMPINFSGDGVLSQDIVFNGETFVSGSKVDSDLDIDLYQAGLAWYLVNMDDSPVRLQLGPEISAIYVSADAKMKEDLYNMSESDSVKVPVAAWPWAIISAWSDGSATWIGMATNSSTRTHSSKFLPYRWLVSLRDTVISISISMKMMSWLMPHLVAPMQE